MSRKTDVRILDASGRTWRVSKSRFGGWRYFASLEEDTLLDGKVLRADDMAFLANRISRETASAMA